MKSSARNQLTGMITQLDDADGVCMVSVLCENDVTLFAQVSCHSVQRLKLAIGCAVMVMIKASSIVVATELAPIKLSAENCLHGTVVSVEKGAVNNVVTLMLQQGIPLSATITLYSSETLALQPGQAAVAVFNASQVILGVLA